MKKPGAMYNFGLSINRFSIDLPKNIALIKDQIISYSTELHEMNVTSIQDHIDNIKSNQGIKSCYLREDFLKI